MKAAEIRQTFLDFFREKGHTIVPSAPIVVKDDPTLMFTNAGMNQFKDIFLGNRAATDKRVADTQKCLRVSGKHNDLEEVGIDTYHHTMFEMLGNWSFGDYFKKEAIAWAWELLTERYKLDKERLYVTVFEGDEKEGLERDDASREYWKQFLPEDRILFGNKKDNFWEMGDAGPCGPSSEIHFDNRNKEERKAVSGRELVNNDHPQVIEIWNNVFIQFNRKADGSLEPLPNKHVDTGMGFERLVRVLQGKNSNYDSDVFMPLIDRMVGDFNQAYGQDEQKDIAMRVMADHIRAVSFTIADGQLPSNTGAGYVIRRILRRAVRYGYTFLGMEESYLYKLVEVLAKQFDNVFPSLKQQQEFVQRVVQEEEAAFLRTLATGTRLFEKHAEAAKNSGTIPGEAAFELYDTFGFPFDLTQLMARERGLSIDETKYREELQKQKDRSRAATARTEGDWTVINEGEGLTPFVGYDQLETPVRLLRYRQVTEKGSTRYHLVFDRTPFYAEGGGQVGDTGILVQEGLEPVAIENTFRENELIVHVASQLPERTNDTFTAIVNKEKREALARHHSATHLLHAALRKVLGSHVAQRGSLVAPDYLRFDFSHFAKMTDEEIAKVEEMVNEKIRENIPLGEERDFPFDKAIERGAMALFGEKYGERVRMITFGPDYSVELCGGTHVPATGTLGFFKITQETAVAAGVRRITALTGEAAERWVNEQLGELQSAKAVLKNPKDLSKSIEGLQGQIKELQNEIESLKAVQVMAQKADLLQKAENLEGIQWIGSTIEGSDANAVKALAGALADSLGDAVILLASNADDKANLWLFISQNLVKERGLNAGQMIREIAKEVNGGGGGAPNFASAGGKNPAGIEAALQKGKELVESILAKA